METSRLIVKLIRPDSPEAVETQVFSNSPVFVGASAASSIRLKDPLISAHQGVFIFTRERVRYVDYSTKTSAIVDDVFAAPGESFPVHKDTLLWIGPFALRVEVESAAAAPAVRTPAVANENSEVIALEQEAMETIRTVTRIARRLLASNDSLAYFLARAVKLADVVSAVIVRARAAGTNTAKFPFDTSPLRTSWDAHEISAYLLDTNASTSRLAELERYLVELTLRAELNASIIVGQA